MMNNDEFDDLIRSKLEENSFSFDESDWDQAEQLLNKHRKKEKRRRFMIIWFFGIISGVVFTLLGLWGYDTYYKDGNEKVYAETSVNKLSDTSNEKLVTTNENLNKQADTIKKIKPETNKEQKRVDINAPNFINNEEKKISKQPKISLGSDLNSKKGITKNLKATLTKQPTKDSLDYDHSISKDVLTSVDSIIKNKNATALKTGDSTLVATESNQDTTIKSLALDTLQAKEIAKQQDSVIDKKDSVFSRFNIYLSAGPTYQAGWKYKDTHDGSGLGFITGLGFEYFFSKKVSVTSGLYVYNSGSLNNYSDSVVYVTPDFGKRDSVLKCIYKRIYFVELPVEFNYYLNRKNRLGVGVNASAASITSCNLQTIMQTDPGEAILNEERRYNYFKGVRKINLGAQLTYSYSFSDKWFLQFLLHYGITDSMDDKVFKNASIVERNTSARIKLNYKIFRK